MAKKILKGGEKLPGGQEHLPDMEPMPKNEKIHRLARRTKAAVKECSKAKAAWQDLKEQTIEAMRTEGLTHYEYGDVKVDLDTKRQLKIKIANEEEDE